MITITLSTSSPKAVAWAKKLAENKKEMQRETRENAKSPEYRAMIAKLKEENGGGK